jgi:catechol 2,3-dioxygenase-like lactoylglutathione lyase family enzyme
VNPRVWYLVRDFDRGRDFYKRLLGFNETYVDWDDKWSKLERGSMRIALGEGEPTLGGGVAELEVTDVLGLAERLRGEGVEVGTVVELAGMRLVDVLDPDGNRLQLTEDVP